MCKMGSKQSYAATSTNVRFEQKHPCAGFQHRFFGWHRVPPLVFAPGHAIQFQLVPAQFIAELFRDLFLQRLDIGIHEFDHLA